MFAAFTLFSTFAASASAFDNSTAAVAVAVSKDAIPTVSTLDLNSYQGYWFQMYDNLRAEVFTPKDQRCITADYSIREDGKLGVHNYGINQDSVVSTIDGYAYGEDVEEPGQLKLHLDGVPTEADYWVNELGPVNANGLYDWALVSSPKAPKSGMYILARDVEQFREKYEAEVLALVTSLGFDGRFNVPIATYQEADCVYDYEPEATL
jgi:apolipoprotein D and lipocalin family protein